MFLLRLQLLNAVKGGEKKKKNPICAPPFVLQLGRRQKEKLLLATRGTLARERWCLPSRGIPPPLALPPKTVPEIIVASWPLELSREPPTCCRRPVSHFFLQIPPFPNKEDLIQPPRWDSPQVGRNFPGCRGPPALAPVPPKLSLHRGHLKPRRSVGFESLSWSPDGDGDKAGPKRTKFRQESRYSQHLGEIRSAEEELGATSIGTESGESFRARFRPSLKSCAFKPWNSWLKSTPGDGIQRS